MGLGEIVLTAVFTQCRVKLTIVRSRYSPSLTFPLLTQVRKV